MISRLLLKRNIMRWVQADQVDCTLLLVKKEGYYGFSKLVRYDPRKRSI